MRREKCQRKATSKTKTEEMQSRVRKLKREAFEEAQAVGGMPKKHLYKDLNIWKIKNKKQKKKRSNALRLHKLERKYRQEEIVSRHSAAAQY